MTRSAPTAARSSSRLSRLPLVVALALGLLLSLIHCAGCGLAFAGTDSPSIATTTDTGATPDIPDQQLPAHSGHCLSHVAAQAIAAISMPADLAPQTLVLGESRAPRPLAGLPLFKPPRA